VDSIGAPPRPGPTVFIVDDEHDMRLLVRMVLDASIPGVEVVGEASDGDEALVVYHRLAVADAPDVVILDNRMPGRSGLEVAAALLGQVPAQQIVLFSAYVTPDLQDRARQAGVAACVGKADFDTLPDVVAGLARRHG